MTIYNIGDAYQVMPSPMAWPECATCSTAWVLRRCFTFGKGDAEWLWQRDCKHKSEPVLGRASDDDAGVDA